MRFLLALIALLLALPATAVPACAAAPREHVMAGMAMPAPDGRDPHRAMAGHVCVGCVPAGDWLRPVVAPPVPAAKIVPVAAAATIVTGQAIGPPLPPPRG